jgi:hypothetical protein
VAEALARPNGKSRARAGPTAIGRDGGFKFLPCRPDHSPAPAPSAASPCSTASSWADPGRNERIFRAPARGCPDMQQGWRHRLRTSPASAERRPGEGRRARMSRVPRSSPFMDALGRDGRPSLSTAPRAPIWRPARDHPDIDAFFEAKHTPGVAHRLQSLGLATDDFMRRRRRRGSCSSRALHPRCYWPATLCGQRSCGS